MDYLYLDLEVPQNVGFNWEKFYQNDEEEAYDTAKKQKEPKEDSIFSALKLLEPITINININFNNTDG